jgi:hypothetical protein
MNPKPGTVKQEWPIRKATPRASPPSPFAPFRRRGRVAQESSLAQPLLALTGAAYRANHMRAMPAQPHSPGSDAPQRITSGAARTRSHSVVGLAVSDSSVSSANRSRWPPAREPGARLNNGEERDAHVRLPKRPQIVRPLDLQIARSLTPLAFWVQTRLMEVNEGR